MNLKAGHIVIWSDEYGFMEFGLDYFGLYAKFKSKTDNFNVEEVVHYRWNRYDYQIRYSDKSIPIIDNGKGTMAKEIFVRNFICEPNKVQVKMLTWKNGNIIYENTNNYDGTLIEAIKLNQMGIDAISRFQFLLNKILPFKKEIFSFLLEGNPYLDDEGISLFLPDICNKKNKTLTK